MVRKVCGNTASLGPQYESFLYKKRFIDLFKRTLIFTDGRGKSTGTYRTTFEGSDNCAKDLVVNAVQSPLVNLELIQGKTRNLQVYMTVAHHLSEVTDALQKGICDTWSATASKGNLFCGILVNSNFKNGRRSFDNTYKVFCIIIFKCAVDTKTLAQRCCQKAASRSRSDKGERIQGDSYRPCTRTFINHDINHVILHGRIKVLFHFGRKTMHLINKKNITGLKRSQESCKVTGLIKDRPGSDFHVHSHLVCDDMRKSGLSKAGRAMKKNMVKGFAPHLCGAYIYIEIGYYLTLSGEVIQLLRPDNSV